MDRDRIAVLADGHLHGDDPGRIGTLVAALDALADRCAAVYILGDLFEVWLGLRTRLPHVAAVAEALQRLRARGVRSAYVEGNRDYLIGRGATAAMFDRVERRELVERFGDATFHFSHGDLVNVHDRQYQAWRAVSKAVIAPVLLRLLPERASLAIAARLESGMRSTNRRHKSCFPEDACRVFATARVAEGADVVVVGHFHKEVVLPIEAERGGPGGVERRTGTFVSLPFWHDEPRPLFFDRAGRLVGGDAPHAQDLSRVE